MGDAAGWRERRFGRPHRVDGARSMKEPDRVLSGAFERRADHKADTRQEEGPVRTTRGRPKCMRGRWGEMLGDCPPVGLTQVKQNGSGRNQQDGAVVVA